ncbi:MAG: DMT family transporter [Cytophagales bacterium]|nr:DMT family transporter [Cytophagales bacterium]
MTYQLPRTNPYAAPQTANTPSADSPLTAISPLSWLLIFFIPAFWAVNYLIARRAPALIAPNALTFARWGLAVIMLALFAWPELKAKRHLIWAERWHALALGVLGMWICGSWVYIAARTTAANNIALIYALSPVFIVLGAAIFLNERLRKRQWLGVLFAMFGLVHVVIQGRWSAIAQTQFVTGDLWMLGCAIAWAVYSVLLKRWPCPFSPLARLVLIAAAGTLFTLPIALLEAASGLPFTQTVWSWQTLGLIVAVAVFPSSGAYLAYGVLQKRIGAARTALVLYLGPLYAAALAWFALGEPLYIYHAIGLVIILPGIYLASQAPSPSENKA